MAGHIGNPGCCCTADTCCCTWTTIQFYMQFAQNASSDYDCTECTPTNPFLITMSAETCTEDLTDETALGNYLLHYAETFCGPDNFYDSASCGAGFPPGDPALGIRFNCVSKCFESSFTGPCEVCTPGELSDPVLFPAYSAYVDVVIRAVAGKFSIIDEAGLDCGVVITVLKKYYFQLAGTDCDAIDLYCVQCDVYYLQLGTTTPGAGECCTEYDTPTVWNNCRQACVGSCEPTVAVCAPAFAVGTIPNPEWGKIEFSC